MRQCLLVLVMILASNFCQSQTTIVSDSCLGNISIYKRLSDSLYEVEAYYGDVKVFEGRIFRPDTTSHLKYYYDDNSIPTDRFDGVCNFYTDLGELYRTINFNNGILKEQKDFKNGRLRYHIEDKKGTLSTTTYNSKGILLSKETSNNSKGFRTSKILIGDKYIETKLKFEKEYGYPISGEELSTDNDYSYFRKTTYKKGYPYGITKETYHRNKVNNRKTFYPDGSIKAEESLDTNGKTIYLTKHSYNRKFGKIVSSKHEVELPEPSLIFEYELNESENKILLIERTRKFEIEYRDSTLIVQEFDLNDPSFKLIYELVEDRFKMIKKDSSGINLVSHMKGIYTYVSKEVLFNTAPEDLLGKLEFINYYFYQYNKHLRQIESYPDHTEYHYSGMQLDSIYKNNTLSEIRYYHNDTSIRYEMIDGDLKITYHSQLTRIAKDANKCAVGLKDINDNWVVPAEFDDISRIDNEMNHRFYYANKGIYTSIYSYDGKLLIPPTIGIRLPSEHSYGNTNFWQLDKKLADSLHLKSPFVIFVSNSQDSIFGLLSLDNRFIIKSKYLIYPEVDYGTVDNIEWDIIAYNSKVGFGDLKGIHIRPEYWLIDQIKPGLFLCKKDSGKIHFIDRNSKRINKMEFDDYIIDKNTGHLITMDNENGCQHYDIDNLDSALHTYKFNLSKNKDNNGFYYIKSNGKSGRISSDFESLIPPKYTNIYQSSYCYMARIKDTCDFYDYHCKFINRIVSDSIYHNLAPISSNAIRNSESWWSYSPINYSNSNHLIFHNGSMVFKHGNKFGIISNRGEIIIEPSYDAIGSNIGSEICTIKDGKYEIWTWGNYENKYIKIEKFPSRHLLAFKFATGDLRNIVFDNKGNVIIKDIDNADLYAWNRFSSIKIVKDGKFIGMLNSRGNWVLKSDTFVDYIEREDKLYYCISRSGKVGVIECNGKLRVPADYQHISYDSKCNILWYNCISLPIANVHRNAIKNIWKIKNLKIDKTLSDTFELPVAFKSGRICLKNNRGLFGVIDSALNILVPFKYNNHFYSDPFKMEYCFQNTDGGIDLYDRNYKLIRHLNYEKILMDEYDGFVAFRNNFCFLLDSNYNILDSSDRLFTDRKDLKILSRDPNMKYNGNYFHAKSKLPLNYETMYEDEEEVTDKTLVPVRTLNLIRTLGYSRQDNNTPYYSNVSFYPQPEYEYHHNPLGIFNGDIPTFQNYSVVLNNPFVLNIKKEYSPRILSLDYFTQKDRYIFWNYHKNFISIRYYEEKDYYTEHHMNLYMGDSCAYVFDLNDLIESSNGKKFNNIIRDQIGKMEDLSIPCFPETDFIELFNDKFTIENGEMVIYINEDTFIKIPLENLSPILRDYWKERLF